MADLEARYIAAARRSLEASRDCDAADRRIVRPAWPEALFVQPNDPLAKCFTPRLLDRREWFGYIDRIDMLRQWRVSELASSPHWSAALSRRAEVLAAHDAWWVALAEAEDAAGETAATAEYRAAWAVEKSIRFEILGLRSDAPDMLRLKLRVFLVSLADIDWRHGLDANVAQGLKAENGPWEDAFAASILRDLATAYMADAV